MSLEKLQKNILDFAGSNVELIIIAGVIFILLNIFIIYISVQKHKSKKIKKVETSATLNNDIMERLEKMGDKTNPSDIQEDNVDEIATLLSMDDDVSDMPPDALVQPENHDMSDQISNNDNTDLTIPRIGETETPHRQSDTPSPNQVQEESLSVDEIMEEIATDIHASLQLPQEDLADAPQPSEETHTTQIDSEHQSMLLDLERQMIALRELHDAGLIATEIYLHKSRELANKIQ